MWCIGKLTPEYIAKMEDVLDTYEKPYNPREPVVCLDEKSVQLLKDVREPLWMRRPGTILRRDAEYERHGTANIFCVVEPRAGRHLNTVTAHRKGPATARKMHQIAQAYPKAKTIHLVMDNLHTHREKSLTDYYGKRQGKAIWRRFTPHYTPEHGSWLNQAEIEVGLVSGQCLGKNRVAERSVLRQRVCAYSRWLNRHKTTIDWRFTTRDARRKFGYRCRKLKGSGH
jgi:DDE superfamily endonuclease